MDYLFPTLGTTVFGLMIIIIFVLLVIIVTILVHIKDYKEIKASFKALKKDIKSNFCGKGNKKKRAKIVGILVLCLVSIFIFSGIYIHSQQPKQLIILSPNPETVLDIWEETTITWEHIPGTTAYFINIYPAIPGMYDGSAFYQFYVAGNNSDVKITFGNLIYGTGPYIIAVSSVGTNSETGETLVYLSDVSSAEAQGK